MSIIWEIIDFLVDLVKRVHKKFSKSPPALPSESPLPGPPANISANLSLGQVEKAIQYIEGLLVEERGDKFRPDVIIGIDRGGAIVAGMLGKKMDRKVTTITLSRDWSLDWENPERSMAVALQDEEYKNILLVDDVCTSGTLVSKAKSLLETHANVGGRPKKVIRTAFILDCKSPEKMTPNYWAYETDNKRLKMPWDR